MKYLIKESQLDVAIKRQLDIMFDVSNIHWTHPLDNDDETEEEFEDPNRIQFYFGDYGDEDSVFLWYGKEYWDENPDNYIKFTSNSPIVIIDDPYHSNLNNLFGNMWYKPFKEWFKENFEVSVKSVMDEIHN
jgi:hypothetical protein